LLDSTGRLIDGDHNGTPGGNAVGILRRTGAMFSAIDSVHSGRTPLIETDAVDHLLEREELIPLGIDEKR
jgi:hypothetical protein